MGLLELISNAIRPKRHADRKAKCPKCGSVLNLSMERCPSCGTHVELMFRIECPRCKAANALKADKCIKCGYSFVEHGPVPGKEQYECPICGYVADYYMMSCPSCGVEFV